MMLPKNAPGPAIAETTLSPELYTKVRRLHFKTRYLANDIFAGQYVSAFKGKGMEFAEVREYAPGDDVRDIDWNVTARFGSPFVKMYCQERELTVLLAVDCSASNLFGSKNRFKMEAAAQVAGLLSFVAIRTNDKVGALFFSKGVDRFIPPRKGAGHVWRLIKEIFTHQAADRGTNIAKALEYINRVVRRHCIVFMISDFLVPLPDKRLEVALSLCAKKHDVTIIKVNDPRERELPDSGFFRLVDPETGRHIAADFSDRGLKAKWRNLMDTQDEALARLLAANRAGLVSISTDGPTVEPLAAYFRGREGRR
jgi:uncharacterized protein (DUF58 family)